MADSDAPEAGTNRRTFIGLTALIAAAMGAMLGYPLIRLFAAPLSRRRKEEKPWVPIGRVDEFGDQRKETIFTYEHQEGWYNASRSTRVVVGREAGEWVVISTLCTHLGCGVTWQPEQRTFLCPCHGGVFDADGKPIVPPPDKALKKLRARERGGMLEVQET